MDYTNVTFTMKDIEDYHFIVTSMDESNNKIWVKQINNYVEGAVSDKPYRISQFEELIDSGEIILLDVL